MKSQNGNLKSKILDGAYSTMIQRISSDLNPNLFLLTYNKANWTINDFLIIPKYFFVPEIIVKRKPLSLTAKRFGWIGCNIDISQIPKAGRIFLIKQQEIIKKDVVLNNWKSTLFIKSQSHQSRGWTIEVLKCIDKISSNNFTLNDVYAFESYLKTKYPNNNFVKEKIRQQLQILRDKGLIEFKSKGNYIKVVK